MKRGREGGLEAPFVISPYRRLYPASLRLAITCSKVCL